MICRPQTIQKRSLRERDAWSSITREGAYNPFGRNCESIANWCVAGYGESHQWKRAQGLDALFGAGLLLWFSYRSRQGSVSTREIRIALVLVAARAVPVFMYYRHNKRFYETYVRRPVGSAACCRTNGWRIAVDNISDTRAGHGPVATS